KPVSHNPQAFFIRQRDEPVGNAWPDGIHPVPDAGRDSHPQAVPGVAQNEVDLADRVAVDAVMEHAAAPFAVHHLEAVGPEIGDEEVAIASEGKPVRQRAFGEPPGKIGGSGETAVRLLGDEGLRAIRGYPHHPAACIGGPQGSVGFGKNTLGALQSAADELQILPLYAETFQRVHSRARVNPGNTTRAARVSSMMVTKGRVPMKMSRRVMRESFRVLLMTKTLRPKGGVRRPISTATMVMMPNQIRFISNPLAIGSISGRTMSRMELESMKQPRRTIRTI